jgi:hypothetical protein
MTQNERIYDHLLAVGPIRPMVALHELKGVYRLSIED